MEGGCAEAVVDWTVGGAGEAGREGRLRIGRVRRAFIFVNFLEMEIYAGID